MASCEGRTYAAFIMIIISLGCGNIQGIYGCPENSTLYFIDDHFIKCVELDHDASPNSEVETVVSNIVEGTAIDIDVRRRMVFWSDISVWTINSMDLNTREVKVILKDNIGQVYAIAVEYETGLIYWTDFLYERIEVAKIDGSCRKTLVTQDVTSPIGIAVDPGSGYVFWTDHDYARPKLVRADLSGDNVRVLANNFPFGLPFYLTINYGEQRIYWVDIHVFSRIRSVDYNGNNFATIRWLGPTYFPLDLAVFGNNLYWADFSTNSVQRIDVTGSSSSISRFTLSQYYIFGVVISDVGSQPIAIGQGPCAVNNGECSDLCLLTPARGKKCACPDGVTMGDDGTTCSNETLVVTPAPFYPVVEVRLNGSRFHNRGRVEVLRNGTWGTICDDYWGISEAHVICRMLNYSGAEFAAREAAYGAGPSDMPIWLDNVKCRGDESTIAACRHNGWSLNDCDHSEDASVGCWTESTQLPIEPTLSPGPHPELQVKLFGANSQNEGRVEIKLNGTWGTVCDDYWGTEEANVICRMLNFTRGALTSRCCGWYNGFGVPEKIWLDNVQCVGDETSIAECRHGGWGSHNCRHTEDVGVICIQDPVNVTTGQIVRLVDGARRSEGRVEIFHDNQWGTVCDDQWDEHDADVVCRMLNFSRALRAHDGAFFGRGNGRIWLGDVHCLGNESSILECEHGGWNVDSCGHHEDASAICEEMSPNLESRSFLLACEAGRGLIYHMALDSNQSEIAVPLSIKTDKPVAITYNHTEKRVYWIEEAGTIFSSYLNGSSRREVVSDDTSRPSSVAIDYVGNNLYIADKAGGRIAVSKHDGRYQYTIINISSPTGIALDSKEGYIYVASSGINPHILRADMDGTNQIVLHNVTTVRGTTVDIALDKQNRRLYYSDKTNNLIKCIDLDTLLRHSVISGNPHEPVGLTLFKGTLYWTGGGSDTFSGAIYKASTKNPNGSAVHEVANLLSYPKGLYAQDSSASEPSVNHTCATNNGWCTHLCLINHGGYSCACPTNINESCKTTPSPPVFTTVARNQVTSTTPSSYSVPSSSVVPSPSSVLSSSSSFLRPVSPPLPRATFLRTPSSSVVASSSSGLPSSSSLLRGLPSSSSLLRPVSPPLPRATFSRSPSSLSVSSSFTAMITSSSAWLTPTATPTAPSSSPTSPVDYCLIESPCQNEGECHEDGPSYTCLCQGYYGGKNCTLEISNEVVIIEIVIQKDKFNVTEFKLVLAEILNNLCKSGKGTCPVTIQEGSTRKRRALNDSPFTPDSIVIPTEPQEADSRLHVEFAAVSDRSHTAVPSDKLAEIVTDSSALISQRLGGNVVGVRAKSSPPTTEVPRGSGSAEASKGGSDAGVVAGVVIAVVVLVILLALAVWFFRMRMTRVPYQKNTDELNTRVASFENPGYGNASGFETPEDALYEDLPPVVFSPLQEMGEFGAASNPIYTDMNLQKLSFQDFNPKQPEGRLEFGNRAYNNYKVPPSTESTIRISRISEDGEKTDPLPTLAAQNRNETSGRRSLPVLVLDDEEDLGKDSEM